MSYKKKKILAVVPARAGSRTIPKKNVRFLNGKPLIVYVLETLVKVESIDKIIVTTDDEGVMQFVRGVRGVELLHRPEELAGDDVTLDPVVIHAYQHAARHEEFDYVFTFQPTSPLLTAESIVKGIRELINGRYDSLLSVVDDRHLRWGRGKGGVVPIYEKRMNRQMLPPAYRETGAIIACSKDVLESGSRIGRNIHLLELSAEESIDIDDFNDWILAEGVLRRPRIGFIVIGNTEKGLGHVYRALTISQRFNCKPKFYVEKDDELAKKRITRSFYDARVFRDTPHLESILREDAIDLVINDTLDTHRAYMETLKSNNRFVVSFEDFGDGAESAHLVFNALYESTYPKANQYFGFKYFCLRDEFLYAKKKQITDHVRNVLITFGGTDQNDLSKFVFDCLKDTELSLEIIVGSGYKHFDTLKKHVGKRARVFKSVERMSEHMLAADIIVTSNGRTTFETACLGVPSIAIAQNDREMKHLFGDVTRTVINLGLCTNVDDKLFTKAFNDLSNDAKRRRDINSRMIELELQKGIETVVNIILREYHEFKNR